MAAAMACFPWTTACSPKTMTLPGAETIKGGAMGEDAFRDIFALIANPFVEDVSIADDEVGEGVRIPSELSVSEPFWEEVKVVCLVRGGTSIGTPSVMVFGMGFLRALPFLLLTLPPLFLGGIPVCPIASQCTQTQTQPQLEQQCSSACHSGRFCYTAQEVIGRRIVDGEVGCTRSWWLTEGFSCQATGFFDIVNVST